MPTPHRSRRISHCYTCGELLKPRDDIHQRNDAWFCSHDHARVWDRTAQGQFWRLGQSCRQAWREAKAGSPTLRRVVSWINRIAST